MTNLTAVLSQTPPTSPSPQKRVLIIGGSTRAAAVSALRAGLQPVCADLFADLDTQQIAEVIPVRSFPDSLPDDVKDVIADGWFYTGALENRPDLIERMQSPTARYGPLWGTGAAALRLIRSPFWVSETLRSAGWPTLEVLSQTSPPPANGQWMWKPLSSAGGRGVCVWNEQTASRKLIVSPNFERTRGTYFQQRMHGTVLSALYRRGSGSIEFLGITRQFAGHEWSRASEPHVYCGSIGPVPPAPTGGLNDRMRRELNDVVDVLAAASGLWGTFGIDFIVDEAGIPWILEVNPRYTASVEILELAQKRSLIYVPGMSVRNEPLSESAPLVVAKRILYADRPLQAPDLRELWKPGSVWECPELVDIPVPGTDIPATWPICTCLAAAPTHEECLRTLHDRVDTVWKMVNDRPNNFVGVQALAGSKTG